MRPDLPLETANAAFMSALQVDAIGIEGVQVLRLDLEIVAAVARAETADPSAILLKVFAALVAAGNDLGARPKVLDELASFGLESAFSAMAERELRYREPGKDPPACAACFTACLPPTSAVACSACRHRWRTSSLASGSRRRTPPCSPAVGAPTWPPRTSAEWRPFAGGLSPRSRA